MSLSLRKFKKIFLSLSLIALFALMLFFPAPVLRGAECGLLLWFNTVLPTLFPFILICNLMITTRAIDLLVCITRPLLCRAFRVSPYGSFAVLTGFLCGYPMGAKVTADLYRQGNITKTEASYLLSFCNNTSPMFILSFLVMQNLKNDSLKLPTLIILFLAPVIISFACRPQVRKASAACAKPRASFSRASGSSPVMPVPSAGTSAFSPVPSSPSVRSTMPPVPSARASASSTASPVPSARASLSGALDFSIGNALESITKVGVYIMVFAVFTELAKLLPARDSLPRLILLSSLEITGGITMLCQSLSGREILYILCLAQTSFGGLCAAAQTASMIKGTGISVSSYIIKKLATALVASLLACLYLYLS